MDGWSPILAVIAAAVGGALATLLVTLAKQGKFVWQRRRAAWRVTLVAPGIHQIEWLGKRPALEAYYWMDVHEGGATTQTTHLMVEGSGLPDVPVGFKTSTRILTVDSMLSFGWIDLTRKTASVWIREGMESFDLIPNKQ